MKPKSQKSLVDINPWELDLLKKVAQAFRTEEREELVAELARKLAQMKAHPPRNIRYWKAYLAKFLYNKASNWVRENRARRKHEFKLDERYPAFESTDCGCELERIDIALSIAFLWSKLHPRLRRVWVVLGEEHGNRAATARRLHIHRNTVRLRIAKIARVMKHHGLGAT